MMMNARAATSTSAVTRIGRFYITRELANGPIGTVYLGRDPIIDREVAIKTFSAKLPPLERKQREHQLINEARAAGRLSHPNIITIYDASSEHNIAYIAMEYLQGQTLDRLLEKGNRFSVADTASIVWKLADALSYAHQNGVVHRDIKPSNIFLVADRQPKIVDFGIARAPNRLPDDLSFDDSGPYTLSNNNLLGTPAYMSPEQALGRHTDERSDIYSLGAVMYEMLTGRKPFHAKTTDDLLNAIAHKAPPAPHELNPKVSATLSQIVMKAMNKKQEKRYQAAGEMADDIKNYMNDERRARRVKKSMAESMTNALMTEDSGNGRNGTTHLRPWVVVALIATVVVSGLLLWLR